MRNFSNLKYVFLLLALLFPSFALAQTGGEAGIEGTVTDSTGAAIPNATVVATNSATGVVTTRQTSGAGLYTISPVIPGVYSVKVTADRLQRIHPEQPARRRARAHAAQYRHEDRRGRQRDHRQRGPAAA